MTRSMDWAYRTTRMAISISEVSPTTRLRTTAFFNGKTEIYILAYGLTENDRGKVFLNAQTVTFMWANG